MTNVSKKQKKLLQRLINECEVKVNRIMIVDDGTLYFYNNKDGQILELLCTKMSVSLENLTGAYIPEELGLKQKITRMNVNFKNRVNNDISIEFEEVKSDSGYGRDIYISVIIYCNQEFNSDYMIDCRYLKNYDFETVCLDFVFRKWNIKQSDLMIIK